jgi:hypothetical protein
MRRSRRWKFTLVWSLWLACLAIATEPACLAHPMAHDHDEAHASLCIDTSSPMAQRGDKPTLLTDGRSFPCSSKSLPPGVSYAAIRVHLPLGLSLSAQSLSQIYEHTLISPARVFPVVLRL